MNKYQKALDIIKSEKDIECRSLDSIYEEEFDKLQELVDKVPYYEELEAKATPKKVIDINDIEFEMYKCPCCNHKWISNGNEKYCVNCGQAIDWSEDEPK